ncbi:MAG: FGGY-family carbohydrate kinase [Eggerthellales bacterium]|nr:FGGY-family carbohydrate kinase [Eggerthellales bacterium]
MGYSPNATFTGLGAPYWDADARDAIYGLTCGAAKNHLVRACLEAQAYQVNDVLKAMEQDSGISVACLNVDGGAARNNFMLHNCADILDTDIARPKSVETTALGAAYMAGLASGFWKDVAEIKRMRGIDAIFHSNMADDKRQAALAGWAEAVERTRSK